MKFYQIITPVIICFMYFTVSFGAEKAIYIPTKIENPIDEFRAGERDCYYETGHIRVSDSEKEVGDIRKVSCSQDFILFTYKMLDSKKQAGYSNLPLSNMQREGQTEKLIKFTWREKNERESFDNEFGKGVKISGITGQLIFRSEENKEIGVFRDMKEDSYMCSLKTPERITALNVSEDGKVIVTCGEGGMIRKWKFFEELKNKINDIYPNGRIIMSVDDKPKELTCTNVSKDGKVIEALSAGGIIYKWEFYEKLKFKMDDVCSGGVIRASTTTKPRKITMSSATKSKGLRYTNVSKDEKVVVTLDEGGIIRNCEVLKFKISNACPDKKTIVFTVAKPSIIRKVVENKTVQMACLASICIIFFKYFFNQIASKL